MKSGTVLCAFAAALLLSGSASAGTEEMLKVSQEKSSIGFGARKLVTGSEKGTFSGFSGTVRFVEGRPDISSVEVTIDLRTVNTGKDGLNRHLRSADFFDVEKYPESKFVSRKVEQGKDGVTITGDLTLRGVTKSISFPATVKVLPDRVVADAAFKIDRQQFGVAYPGSPDNLIQDDVDIVLHLQMERLKK